MEELKKEGWFVDEVKLSGVLGDDYDKNATKDALKSILLDMDVKEYGSAVLFDKTNNAKSLVGPIVLQLNKWQNVSYPKIADKTENNGVISCMLSDGSKTVKCMATEPIQKLDGRTPYGSKISLSGDIRIEGNILQLTSKNTSVLGGDVEKQVEKWKAEKLGSKDMRGGTSTAAPKWVPFGKKGSENVNSKDDKDFKALKTNESEVKASENTEFDSARKAEIENLKAVKSSINMPLANVELKESVDASKSKRQDSDRKEYKEKRNNDRPSNRGGDGARGSDRGRGRARGGRDRDDDDGGEFAKPRPNNTLFDSVIGPTLGPVPDAANVTDKFSRMDTEERPQRSNPRDDNRGRGNFQNRPRGDHRGGRGSHHDDGRNNFRQSNQYGDQQRSRGDYRGRGGESSARAQSERQQWPTLGNAGTDNQQDQNRPRGDHRGGRGSDRDDGRSNFRQGNQFGDHQRSRGDYRGRGGENSARAQSDRQQWPTLGNAGTDNQQDRSSGDSRGRGNFSRPQSNRNEFSNRERRGQNQITSEQLNRHYAANPGPGSYQNRAPMDQQNWPTLDKPVQSSDSRQSGEERGPRGGSRGHGMDRSRPQTDRQDYRRNETAGRSNDVRQERPVSSHETSDGPRRGGSGRGRTFYSSNRGRGHGAPRGEN